MLFEILTIVALLGSVATASPTKKISTSVSASVCGSLPDFNDGRGASIYKNQTCGGDAFGIPGNSNYCTDLDNIFAQYDGKLRSFRVEKGYQCEFFL